MGDQVRLRPVEEDDVQLLEDLTQDPEKAGVFARFGWFDPGRYRRRWAENRLIGEDCGTLVVIRSDERLGFVTWRRRQTTPAAYCWSMGIGLLPEARGRGYGTEAHRLLARYLFAHTTVHRIEADTEVENIAEQRALEKAGFTREGVMRGCGWRDGAWRDGVTYSLLRTDPPV
ncbi:GNAT family N-acetyltransferase [Actinoallomurus purpureus]|uniref:GNAT family N-acetyltransferase n=1 Tax=Actinoallomurus purpureus TaxID=478114 RepID=UPI0020922D7A|nr:GNAT family protein [Actinoallomurus purpureus]MCO6009323.1 GNAT family N-acetyltransferase [Actinoallomurus purpureus]